MAQLAHERHVAVLGFFDPGLEGPFQVLADDFGKLLPFLLAALAGPRPDRCSSENPKRLAD